MPDHGGLMLAARITFAHISISAAMRVANSHAPPRVHHAAQRVGNHGAYPAQLQALLRAKGRVSMLRSSMLEFGSAGCMGSLLRTMSLIEVMFDRQMVLLAEHAIGCRQHPLIRASRTAVCQANAIGR
jgi:hypothetical protein